MMIYYERSGWRDSRSISLTNVDNNKSISSALTFTNFSIN